MVFSLCSNMFTGFCDCVCVCVFLHLPELNVKPISKPLIQLVVEIYSGAASANL